MAFIYTISFFMINCSDRLFLLTLRFSGVTFPIAYIYFLIIISSSVSL